MRKLQSSEKREYRMRKDNKIENRRIRWRQTETRGCSSETSGAQHKTLSNNTYNSQLRREGGGRGVTESEFRQEKVH